MTIRHLLLMFSLIVLLCGEVFAQTDTLFLDRWHFIKQGIVGVYDVEGNFNPGRYKWTILTPSQSPIPELSTYVDPNQIQPFPEVSAHTETRNLSTLIYRECFESNECEFSFPQTEPGPGKGLRIRLAGIHTPRVNASCEQEAFLGNQAKNILHDYLSSAIHIELRNVSEKGKALTGRLVTDGQDLSELLVSQGLAVLFGREKKDWCN